MSELPDASCAHCRAISTLNGENNHGRIGSHYSRVDQYPDFPALEASAGKGCAFCGLLRHALQDKYSDKKIAEFESDFDPSIRANWPVSEWNGQVTVDHAVFRTEEDWTERDANQAPDQSLSAVRILSLEAWPYPPRRSVSIRPELSREILWFAVYAETGSEASLHGNLRRRKPDKEALSGANISLISKWLSACSRLHPECRHKGDAQLPTRVIDVGWTDSSQEPRLVVTSKESGDYVALSHCWGSLMESDDGRYARTLKINLKDMQREIPLIMLPQNFQDAILTVRKLQLRYLWIDALCIIQDDPVDWAREAARMNDVYGSAYLTISATSAVSSTDGFLKRSPDMMSSIPYYKDVGAESAGVFFLAYMRTGGDQGSWLSTIETARWNSRGWTFQERLLSKRLLHFTEKKVFWECRATDASEENEPPRDPRYRTSWLKDKGPSGSSLLPKPQNRASESRFDTWYRIVTNYSAREFSYEKDVLPALSGLAHTFRAIHGMGSSTDKNDYLAGIWRDDLSRGLLWTSHDRTHASRYSQYIAPTWSWASVKGQIHFPSGGSDTQFSLTFVNADTELKAEDHMGAIVAATLKLLAKVQRLCEVAVKPQSSWFPLDLRSEGKTIGSGTFDVNQDESGKYPVWVMQCAFQEPWDFRDHPTVLLLHGLGGNANKYWRLGVGKMEEDSLGFFDDCEPQEIILL